LRLQLLETFTAAGSDGSTYKVCAYDRMTTDPSLAGEHWESTGSVEYRLEDGRAVQMQRDGTAHIERSDVVLTLPARAAIA
jgi:hypothetical protein